MISTTLVWTVIFKNVPQHIDILVETWDMVGVIRGVEVLLIEVWTDVIINVLTFTMVGVDNVALVDVVVDSVLIYLKLVNPSLFAVDVLAGDWDEAVVAIDLLIGMWVDELIGVLARV